MLRFATNRVLYEEWPAGTVSFKEWRSKRQLMTLIDPLLPI